MANQEDLSTAAHQPEIFERGRDIFCEIIEGKAPSVRIFDTQSAVVIVDKFSGYPLILSREHSTKDLPGILKLAGEIAAIVEKAYEVKGVRILCNIGEEAGQEIPHPHVHVQPRERTEHGGGRLKKISSPTESGVYAQRLRELWEDLPPRQ